MAVSINCKLVKVTGQQVMEKIGNVPFDLLIAFVIQHLRACEGMHLLKQVDLEGKV